MSRGYILTPDEIAERKDLAPSHKLVMSVLARLQGDKASCWPSYEYIAKACGLSKRQVMRVVCDLRARKEIIVLTHPMQSNSYSVPWATARAMRKKWATAKKKSA